MLGAAPVDAAPDDLRGAAIAPGKPTTRADSGASVAAASTETVAAPDLRLAFFDRPGDGEGEVLAALALELVGAVKSPEVPLGWRPRCGEPLPDEEDGTWLLLFVGERERDWREGEGERGGEAEIG